MSLLEHDDEYQTLISSPEYANRAHPRHKVVVARVQAITLAVAEQSNKEQSIPVTDKRSDMDVKITVESNVPGLNEALKSVHLSDATIAAMLRAASVDEPLPFKRQVAQEILDEIEKHPETSVNQA